MRRINSMNGAIARVLYLSLSAAVLSACGGPDSGTSVAAPAPAATQTYSLTLGVVPATAVDVALPTFHLAPVILDEPADTDRSEPMSSAGGAPRQVAVDPSFAQLSTRHLTPEGLEQVRATGAIPARAFAQGTSVDPLATTATVTVYTPAQIRAAYGLPVLPSLPSSVTSAQAAQLGAGQTIYLIDAMDEPRVAADLASFDTKFGLPACTLPTIAVSAALPLIAAPTSGCTLSVVYSTPGGAMTATAPAYDASWATEIALDVQWAHATAPYARIILIEAPDSSVASLSAAVQLANKMGPGVVSQSFGAAEGSWTGTLDSAAYSAANMTYLAAAGDTGAGVSWPAASSRVLAVAGTSLTYSGSGARTESVWSGTGGGVSAFVATPTYQSLPVPGLGSTARRAVSDVAFNADPNTGQYFAFTPPGSTSPNWYSAGGTSLSTPQWAGLIAVANALRAQLSLPPIGAAHATLYGLATQSASYASQFLDVTKGADGNCSTCYAGVGYDLPSGLGSPNGQALLAALSTAPASAAPVVTASSVSGRTGTVLTFAITATAAHPLTYSLTGAPAGMSVSASTGLVTWSAPMLGSYVVLAHATDAQTGLSGQATQGVSITASQPPKVTGAAISGIAQTPLAFATQVTAANPVTYSLTGAPSGMSVNTAAVVSWTSPLAGTYAVTLNARDASTGLTGRGLYTVTIAPATAPVVSSSSYAFTGGSSITFCVRAVAANPLTYSLTAAPVGMAIVPTTGCVTWTKPTSGTTMATVTVQDTRTGLSAKGLETLVVTPPGPVIKAASMGGVAGKALAGTIAFSDNTGSALSITIGGAPAGMSFAVTGNLVNVKWASPVTGAYSLKVTAVDAQKFTATAAIPIAITAH